MNEVGILIVGDAGSGKTTVCLELAGRGHKFIADDSVEIERVGRRLNGSAATPTAGLIGKSGHGLSDIPHRGLETSSCGIDLVVEIRDPDEPDYHELLEQTVDGYGELFVDIPRCVLLRHTLFLAESIERLGKIKI